MVTNTKIISSQRWAAIAGSWTIDEPNNRLLYSGAQSSKRQNAFGLAVASERFRDGVISCDIKLSRKERTSAGIVIGYHSLSSPYIVAQLGAFDYAYAITEYRPEAGWNAIESAGSLSNLNFNEAMHVEIQLKGQSLRMTVDEVEVIKALLPAPLGGTGLGLFGFDDAEVTFSNVGVRTNRPRAFIMMPFSEPFETLYRDVILPVTKEVEFDVLRVDETYGPGIILNDIQRQIADSHVVIAEISTHNPNVFYELGYAHALNKPAVLLVRKQENRPMPFDVASYRAIYYDDSIGGKNRVETLLRQSLTAVRDA